jgi:hypothetical protein
MQSWSDLLLQRVAGPDSSGLSLRWRPGARATEFGLGARPQSRRCGGSRRDIIRVTASATRIEPESARRQSLNLEPWAAGRAGPGAVTVTVMAISSLPGAWSGPAMPGGRPVRVVTRARVGLRLSLAGQACPASEAAFKLNFESLSSPASSSHWQVKLAPGRPRLS